MIDTPGSLSGWRILMMMLEHEVHHRSQIDTYAGLRVGRCPLFSDAPRRRSATARAAESRDRH
jgi:uncharacterized damage-inducible protein DinB